MRFALNDELEFFRATTSRFIRDEMPITATRALEHDERGFDPVVWSRAAELGWTSLLAPASLGGGSLSDNPVVDLAIVAEEMGRMVAPGPLVPVNVVVDALTRSGPPALVDAVVPGLMSGATTAAWALAEAADVWGVEGLVDAVLVEDGTDLVLSGRKRFVEAGAGADVVLVSARRAGRTDAGARGRGRTGTHRGARSQHRPGSPIRGSPVRVGSGPAQLRRRRGRWGGDRHRATVPARARVAGGRDRRRRRPDVRRDGRVPPGSMVVRTTARLVPGAEAPARRHAADAGDGEGLCRGGRGRRWAPRARTRRETSASRRRTSAGCRSRS